MFGFFFEANPAIRSNLFIALPPLSAVEGLFLKAIKRISTAIGANKSANISNHV
jgi:hypothetical protein